MFDLSKKEFGKRTYGFRDFDKITNEEKVQLFDELYGEVKEMDTTLVNYKRKRKYKKRIYEERVARGYNFKKKTPKEEYLKKVS